MSSPILDITTSLSVKMAGSMLADGSNSEISPATGNVFSLFGYQAGSSGTKNFPAQKIGVSFFTNDVGYITRASLPAPMTAGTGINISSNTVSVKVSDPITANSDSGLGIKVDGKSVTVNAIGQLSSFMPTYDSSLSLTYSSGTPVLSVAVDNSTINKNAKGLLQVNSAAVLSGYATQSWVTGQGYYKGTPPSYTAGTGISISSSNVISSSVSIPIPDKTSITASGNTWSVSSSWVNTAVASYVSANKNSLKGDPGDFIVKMEIVG